MIDYRISKLKDFYGSLLTKKQFDAIEQFYESDYSLSEIGENLAITRQAVRCNLNLGVKKLESLEDKLGFYKRFCAVRELLEDSLAEDSLNKKDAAVNKALEILLL